MDFQDRRRSGGYHRLEINGGDDAIARRQAWARKVRLGKGVKLSRSRKLNWKPFSMVLMLSKRIARFYGGFLKRMKMDEACPAIVFSNQWGIPVLSHSSSISRCTRNLTWL